MRTSEVKVLSRSRTASSDARSQVTSARRDYACSVMIAGCTTQRTKNAAEVLR
jgi:hypothetical protein